MAMAARAGSQGWQAAALPFGGHLSLCPPPPSAPPAQQPPTPNSPSASMSGVPWRSREWVTGFGQKLFWGPCALPGMHREIRAGETPREGGDVATAQSSAVGLCRVTAAGGPRGRAFPPSRPCVGTPAEVLRAAGGTAAFAPCLCPAEHHPAREMASYSSAVAGAAFLSGTAVFLLGTAIISALRRSTGAGRPLSPGTDGWPQARWLGSTVGS